MQYPLVSVIVPVYNVEEFVEQCIESILHQTYSNLEIILVNDGSKDNSGHICDSYVNKDSRIKVIHKENGGLSDARNFALDVCTGEYISFIDSDDYVESNFIEELVHSILLNNADLSICNFKEFGDIELVDLNPTFFDTGNISGKEILIKYLENVPSHHSKANVVAWNKLYKKHIFKELRFPKGLKYEDSYIMHAIFAACEYVSVTNLPLYNYRQRSNSLANTTNQLSRYHRYLSIKNRFKFFKENSFLSKRVSFYEKRFVLELLSLKESDNSYIVSDFYKNILTIFKYQNEIGRKRIINACFRFFLPNK